MLTNQCSKAVKWEWHIIVEPTKAQHKPAGGNLLEYPVIVVGVLGLRSFIAGGTMRGAGHGHKHIHRDTKHSRGGKCNDKQGINRGMEKKSGRQKDEDLIPKEEIKVKIQVKHKNTHFLSNILDLKRFCQKPL